MLPAPTSMVPRAQHQQSLRQRGAQKPAEGARGKGQSRAPGSSTHTRRGPAGQAPHLLLPSTNDPEPSYIRWHWGVDQPGGCTVFPGLEESPLQAAKYPLLFGGQR